MLSALYYPHVKMSSALVKNALFLWDRVEFIVPHKDFKPWYEDRELGEAVSLIAEARPPSDKEKRQVDLAIIELLKTGLPDWFYVKDIPSDQRYNFYPRKLSEETWERLTHANLAEDIGDGFDTSAPLGLAIMSMLADCCAGSERRLITDEAVSYSALDRYLTTIGGGELGKFDYNSEKLVTISLKVMNLKNVSLSRLIEMRANETAQIQTLRHNYLEKVETYSDRLLQAKKKADAEEIERKFEQEMRNDFELLKDELKDEAKKVVFSKEMLAAAVALAGTFVAPVTGLLIAGGALYRKKIEYRAARNKTLKTHPMSWLYSSRKFPIY